MLGDGYSDFWKSFLFLESTPFFGIHSFPGVGIFIQSYSGLNFSINVFKGVGIFI